jgi:O-antigen/teichoic acid export membrane protein
VAEQAVVETESNSTRSTTTKATSTKATETESIGRKAGRGLGWGLMGNAATKVASFATALVLARLLVPHDYGTYAVALAATQFVIHINDVGLIPATIQWRGKLEEMAPTAATLAGFFSLVVYVGFWFAAPPFAAFSGVPEATPVIRLFTLTILVDGFTAIRSAYLLRTFQQRRYVMANMAGIVANAAVAISLAVAGAGPMSLAGGQLASSLATGTLVMIWAGLPLRVGVDFAIAKRLMAYGIPLTAGLGVESVLEQADKVIVGRVMGATVLGFYLLAFSVSSWAPGMIGSAIRYVSLPGFARLSEKDSDTLSSGVQRAVPLLVIGLVPIAVLIGLLAEPTVHFLYGTKWAPAAGPLRFLMILMVVRMLYGIGMDILMSTGATKWTLFLNLGWLVAVVPALWLGTRFGGGQGAAIAQAIVGVLVAMPLTVIALQRSGVRLAPIAPRLVRPLVAGALAGGFTILVLYLLGPRPPFLQLALAGTGGLLVYLATAVHRRELRGWLVALRARRTHALAD